MSIVVYYQCSIIPSINAQEGKHHESVASRYCFFHELARLASQETLPRFRSLTANQIETKPKEGFRFDPVTEADREAERVIREHITRHYPEHAIMGKNLA